MVHQSRGRGEFQRYVREDHEDNRRTRRPSTHSVHTQLLRTFATEFENDVLLALNLDAKTIQSESPIMKRKLGEERDRIIERITNPQVVAMIANGRDHCRKQIRERIMRDNDGSIDLNTCTNCGRLARTPDAKMCVQCGYTWYDRNKET